MTKHVLDRPWMQQHPGEFALLQAAALGAHAILEVGSCFGHSLRQMPGAASPGARIRSIDLGMLPQEAGSFAGHDVAPALKATIRDLRSIGFDAALHLGDSHAPEAIAFARDAAPYDLVFIDGDHSYDGVKADWENYGPMGQVIAFHDIAHPHCGVARLWAEIKASGLPTKETVLSQMGIGVVRRAA